MTNKEVELTAKGLSLLTGLQVTDWNVTDDEIVELFNCDDRIVGVTDLDTLEKATRYMEEGRFEPIIIKAHVPFTWDFSNDTTK